jgi:hypothetical protein
MQHAGTSLTHFARRLFFDFGQCQPPEPACTRSFPPMRVRSRRPPVS